MKPRVLGKCSTTVERKLEAKSCNLREYFDTANKKVLLISVGLCGHLVSGCPQGRERHQAPRGRWIGLVDKGVIKKLLVLARMAYQLDPFVVGQVKAHMEHGLSAESIAKRVYKEDGKTLYGPTAIQNCMNKLTENPGWRGGREKGSGRPRLTTKAQDKQIGNWVLDNRGKQKVTVLLFK